MVVSEVIAQASARVACPPHTIIAGVVGRMQHRCQRESCGAYQRRAELVDGIGPAVGELAARDHPHRRVGGDEDTGRDHERVSAAVLPAVAAGRRLLLDLVRVERA